MSNVLRSAIIVMVSIVWAANFMAPLFNPEYKPAPELNIAFMAILGVLTASYQKPEKTAVKEKTEKSKETSDE